jgi:hypothetical protein
MNETLKRILLYAAGAWNVVGAASALLDPAAHFALIHGAALTLTDPVQTFFYRVTWINAIAWGVGYILAARSARDRGPILVAGGAGKLAYFGVCLQAFLAGSGTSMLLGTGLVDFVFAAAFIYLVWTRSERESIARV